MRRLILPAMIVLSACSHTHPSLKVNDAQVHGIDQTSVNAATLKDANNGILPGQVRPSGGEMPGQMNIRPGFFTTLEGRAALQEAQDTLLRRSMQLETLAFLRQQRVHEAAERDGERVLTGSLLDQLKDPNALPHLDHKLVAQVAKTAPKTVVKAIMLGEELHSRAREGEAKQIARMTARFYAATGNVDGVMDSIASGAIDPSQVKEFYTEARQNAKSISLR